MANPDNAWMIVYADQDKRPEFFSGHGASGAARERFKRLSDAWTIRLYQCVDDSGYRPRSALSAGDKS